MYWYENQHVQVKFKNSLSGEWKIGNRFRQGGVLSALLFSEYIDSLVSRVSRMSIGCKLGIISSNIIAYADDIVLLAPSAAALSFIIAEAYSEAINLNLSFNYSKTKVMRFHPRVKSAHSYLKNLFCIDNNQIEMVSSIKYLGYIISGDMSCKDDVLRVKRKFYGEYSLTLS